MFIYIALSRVPSFPAPPTPLPAHTGVGQRGLDIFKGEAGWGSSAPHKQTRSYFISAAYILIINRFSPIVELESSIYRPQVQRSTTSTPAAGSTLIKSRL